MLEHEFVRSKPNEEEREVAERYRKIDWNNESLAMCSPLRDLVNEVAEDVRWIKDNMTVFGFTAHQRQLFLESVMR